MSEVGRLSFSVCRLELLDHNKIRRVWCEKPPELNLPESTSKGMIGVYGCKFSMWLLTKSVVVMPFGP